MPNRETPSTSDLQHALAVAERAARAGGEVLMRYYRQGITGRPKQAGGPTFDQVSDADIEAERAIVGVIHQVFPDHLVLGEELHQADAQAEHLWVIDPLDGTNNFLHRMPHFSVSVAYYRRGQAMCGIVLDPLHDICYSCAAGQGAFRNGTRVHVAESSRLDEILVGVGFYYDRGSIMESTLAAIGDLFRQQIHGIRRMGSAALDLCYVGEGIFGAFFEFSLSPWDFAAGQLFVVEAGGQVSDCRGQPLPLAKTGVLATNGRLHASVLDIVRARAP